MKGVYIAVLPTEKSNKLLDSFLHDIPVMRNSLHPHVTMMYHKKDVDDSIIHNVDASLVFEGRPTTFRVWSDHKRRPIIVMQLHSLGLHNRHAFWQRQGLKHTFPYSPHLTITDSSSGASFQELEAYCSIINTRNSNSPLNLEFTNEYATELEDAGKLLTDPYAELEKHIKSQTAMVLAQRKMPMPRLKTSMKPLKRVGPKLMPKVGPKPLSLRKSGGRKKSKK